jgi:hypothetical protein
MQWSLGHSVIHGQIASDKVCPIRLLSIYDSYDPELASMDAKLSPMPTNSMQRSHGLRAAFAPSVSH